MSDATGSTHTLLLTDWSAALERALTRGALDDAVTLAHGLLLRLPRHLATYQRLLRITWMLRRWEEGEEWARRLLQADPGNALAWQSLARAAEQRGHRAQAHAMWQRAFEMNPYAPEIRAGLARTSLETAQGPMLDLACLATLYLRARRWEAAAQAYRNLVKADPRRIDFQVCLMLALWQQPRAEEAYALARHLVAEHPYLVLAWAVIDALGDENDQALAHHPLSTMDPDGDYLRGVMGVAAAQSVRKPPELDAHAEEAHLVARYLEAAAEATARGT